MPGDAGKGCYPRHALATMTLIYDKPRCRVTLESAFCDSANASTCLHFDVASNGNSRERSTLRNLFGISRIAIIRDSFIAAGVTRQPSISRARSFADEGINPCNESARVAVFSGRTRAKKTRWGFFPGRGDSPIQRQSGGIQGEPRMQIAVTMLLPAFPLETSSDDVSSPRKTPRRIRPCQRFILCLSQTEKLAVQLHLLAIALGRIREKANLRPECVLPLMTRASTSKRNLPVTNLIRSAERREVQRVLQVLATCSRCRNSSADRTSPR